MTNPLWFNQPLQVVREQTQHALDLSQETAQHLAAAAVPSWEGEAARAADSALEEVLAAANHSSGELTEAMLLAAEVQQTWLFTQLSRGTLGYG